MKLLLTFFIICSCIQFSKSQDITTDLLLHYPFDGNSEDISGNGFHGIANASLTQDRFGNANSAYSFNGINEYIDLPISSVLKPQLPITYSCWVKFDAIQADGSKTVIATNDFATDSHSGAWINTSGSGNFAANIGDNTGNTSSPNRRTKVGETSLNTGQWYHLVAVIRGPLDMDLYVDCRNDEGTYSGTGGMLAYSSVPGSIGRKDAVFGMPEFYFQGSIDDFRYWNRALTPDDIDLLCQYYLSVEESSIIEDFIFTLFPNPSNGIINIKVSDEHVVNTVIIKNTTGAIVKEIKYAQTISLEGIEKGLYFVNLISGENQILGVKKILINQ